MYYHHAEIVFPYNKTNLSKGKNIFKICYFTYIHGYVLNYWFCISELNRGLYSRMQSTRTIDANIVILSVEK
jgi:hypothetical protein